ncbi:MAG: class I SAM-dependent methyltransferase [Patescibacteria group bacterium]
MENLTYKKYLEYKNEEHWFEIGRKKIFETLFENFLSGSSLNILDVGCGAGEIMESLRKYGTVKGLEKYAPYAEISRKKGFDVRDARLEDLPYKDEKFNLITFFDVLEHLEDDVASLELTNRMLLPGGIVIISVPAFQILWGSSDIAGEHKRRYRKKDLKKKLEASGFKILKLSYFNAFLAPLVFPFLLLKRILTINNLIKTKPNHEMFRNPFINRICAKILFKEAECLAKRDFWFGMSLLAVAQKK